MSPSLAPLSLRRRRCGSAGAGAPLPLRAALPRPPAARAFVSRRRSEPAGRVIGGRRRRRPARPPLMSGRSRGEGSVGMGCAARRWGSGGRRSPGRPCSPGCPLPGLGGDPSPEGHPPSPSALRSALQLPCGRAKASGCPRAPRATPSSREKCQGLNARARGQRGGLPRGSTALRGTPAALGQGHCREGVPPGADARLLSQGSPQAAAKPAPA